MRLAQNRARLDWLAEVVGASALGLAFGFAALKLAPSLGFPTPAMIAAGLAGFALGMLAMRTVRSSPSEVPLPAFNLAPLAHGGLIPGTLAEEPLLLEDRAEDDILLLEDALPDAGSDSRVLQLFATAAMPTPGQIKEQIDRHLMGALPDRLTPPPDASQALYAALDDLRRSLR